MTEGSEPAQLYCRALGERFGQLHPVLQQFHGSKTGGHGSGFFCVTRPGGRLRHTLASLLGLPAAGARVPVRLDVAVEGDTERWVRHFGARPFVTRQWMAHGMLVEAAGLVRFGFALDVVDGGLTFATRRVWLMGLRVPLVLAPTVTATATAEGDGWRVSVGVRVPLFGLLVHYEGQLTPQ